MKICCLECSRLLSEGLNLCVRARKMDAIDRREGHLAWSSDREAWLANGTFDRFAAQNNEQNPHATIETRCLTPQVWMQDQYDRDLAAWEAESRTHILEQHQ